jgi:hypothetical protein
MPQEKSQEIWYIETRKQVPDLMQKYRGHHMMYIAQSLKHGGEWLLPDSGI